MSALASRSKPASGTARTSLDAIFRPRSVAVIGATPRVGTIGHQILRNIVLYGFNGMLFPVNPRYEHIHSIKCYPSVLAIPDPVDLAVIVVPKEHVLKVADECGRKRVKGLVIISAGFREIGGEGAKREDALVELMKKYRFRVIGPNCMGVINARDEVRMNATFAPQQPESGHLAFMSQSGALGVAILIAANRLNLGLSYFASVGNKIDVSGNDLLEFWGRDEATDVIALYIESFGDPRDFTELAKQISKRKPILVCKSGRTAAGSRAASSHTGHLAGLEIAVDGLLQQCGVLRVSSIEEMMDLALAFTKNPIPKGDRVAVLTNAGGPAIMATDALVNEGLEMADLSPETRSRLRELLPEESSVSNPVDMIAGARANEYEKALDAILADPGVDTVIVIFVPPMMVEPREVVGKIAAVTDRHKKPVFSVIMAEERYYEELPRQIESAPPMYRFPESAVRALSAMKRQRLWRERPEGSVKAFQVDREAVTSIVAAVRRRGGGYLSPGETNQILNAYGFPVCKLEVVPVEGGLVEAAARVGYPLVLKVHGSDIIHKSDFGGVAVDIRNEGALRSAHASMMKKLARAGLKDRVEGFLVQEMARGGKEVILGMTTDEQFGPILMFGMGGKYVEIIKDIAFRIMPVTDVDAREMVESIRSYPLLEGVRGEERVDIEFLIESIERLAQLVHDQPSITELDLNPVIVTPRCENCRVVDVRIRVAGA